MESSSLHVGAHKTATTYIQRALEQSRAGLRGNGVGYVPLIEMRPAITRRVGLTGRGLGRSVSSLLEAYGDCRTLILSDENIIGLPDPSRSGVYYPRRRWRLGRLLRRLPRSKVRLFFAIRGYDSFVSSMYSEYIRHRPFLSPEAYLRRVRIERFGWPDVIRSFVALAGAERVTVWRYEDFGRLQDRLFDALTGGRGGSVKPLDQAVRPSLSAQAVATLVEMQSHLSPVEIRDQVQAVTDSAPRGAGDGAFSAYAPERAAELRERYEREADGLEAEFPGLVMLKP